MSYKGRVVTLSLLLGPPPSPLPPVQIPQTLPVKQFKLNIAKKEVDFIETSFKPYGLSCMSNPAFLNNVIEFGKLGKDKINEETIEFLVPYLDIEGFNPQVTAKKDVSGKCVHAAQYPVLLFIVSLI